MSGNDDHKGILGAFLVLFAFCLAGEARAYIDPNSAGVLYQIFFPLIVAVTLAWRWIKETCKVLWLKLTRRN